MNTPRNNRITPVILLAIALVTFVAGGALRASGNPARATPACQDIRAAGFTPGATARAMLAGCARLTRCLLAVPARTAGRDA